MWRLIVVAATALALASSHLALAAEPALVSLELDPTSVPVGDVSQGTVTLSEPAPSDTTITLSVDSPAATVPASVTVPEGASSSLFDVTAVGPPTVVTVSATLNLVTVTAQLTITAGAPFGNSLRLDGIDDYASAADNATLDLGVGPTEDFTIETSFYVADETSDTGIQRLIFKDDAFALSIDFNSMTMDVLAFTLWSAPSAPHTFTGNTDLAAGWHHIAAVFDNEFTASNDRARIFLDGALLSDNSIVDLDPGVNNSGNPLNVGANPSLTQFFGGWLDEMRLSEVVRYTGSYTVPTTQFVNDIYNRALWHFNDAVCSTTFVDASGMGNPLTGANGAHAELFGAGAPTVKFSQAAYSAGEGSGSVPINVVRTGYPGAEFDVSYQTVSGTAVQPDDYTDTEGTLEFGCGEMAKTFFVPIVSDTENEPDETVDLSIYDPDGAILGTPSEATLTITDDDVPRVQFAQAAYSAAESAGTVLLEVTRLGDASDQIEVDYEVTGGTATPGADFTLTAGTLTFADDDFSESISLALTDDALVEANETVTVTLTDVSPGVAISPPTSTTVTITDDDAPPPPAPPGPAATPPTIDGVNARVREGRRPKWLNVTIRLSLAAAQPVQIRYSTRNRSAKAGKDYRRARGVLTVPAGQTSIVLRIRILPDRKREKREQFFVDVTGPTNVDSARITILDRR